MGLQITRVDVELVDVVASSTCVESDGEQGFIWDNVQAVGSVVMT
jgi:hypothetical protein